MTRETLGLAEARECFCVQLYTCSYIDYEAICVPLTDVRRMTATILDQGKTADLAEIFRLLGDPTRLRIVLATLAEPVAVSAIADRVGASPSLVSHHLRLLRAARIVRAERRGKQIFYAAADAHVRDVLRDMIEHIDEPAGVGA